MVSRPDWVELQDPGGVWWTVVVLPGNQRLKSHANSTYYSLFMIIWSVRWAFTSEENRVWQLVVFRSRRLANMWMSDAVAQEFFSSESIARERSTMWCEVITSGKAIAPSPQGEYRWPKVFSSPSEPDVPISGETPPGWRQDPADPFQYRYWDGQGWAAHWAPR